MWDWDIKTQIDALTVQAIDATAVSGASSIEPSYPILFRVASATSSSSSRRGAYVGGLSIMRLPSRSTGEGGRFLPGICSSSDVGVSHQRNEQSLLR